MKSHALYLTTGQMRQAIKALEGVELQQKTLARWLRAGLVKASIRYVGMRGSQNAALFNLDDVVRVRFVLRLRQTGNKWSTPRVREVLADPLLQRALREKTDLRIVIAGRRVLVQSKRDADIATAALQAGLGQYVFTFPAAELLAGNAAVVKKIRRAAAA